MISILRASLRSYDTSSSAVYRYQIEIDIAMSKLTWSKAKRKGLLGFYYNRDTSNALYSLLEGKMPHCEVMLIKEHRAVGEAKTISLRYIFKSDAEAQALGLPGKVYGERFMAKFGAYKNLLERL